MKTSNVPTFGRRLNLSVSPPLLSDSLVGADLGANGVIAMARLREALSARDLGVSDVGLTVTSSAGRDACRLSEPPLIAHPGLRTQA